MGRDLYHQEPVFREVIDQCAAILQPLLGEDIRGVLYPAEFPTQAPDAQNSHISKLNQSKLNQTALTQPALFVVEYALAQLWIAWGIQPVAMVGHSIGEYVAACLAGVFSLEDGLRLVAMRGQLMQSLPAGSMLAIALSAQRGSRSAQVVSGPVFSHRQRPFVRGFWPKRSHRSATANFSASK